MINFSVKKVLFTDTISSRSHRSGAEINSFGSVTLVTGTLAVHTRPPDCPVAVQYPIPLCFILANKLQKF